MSIEFPLVNIKTKFGVIPTPLLDISVLTTSGYQSYQFLFDTGADFTMLPRYMAEDTGSDLKSLRKYARWALKAEA